MEIPFELVVHEMGKFVGGPSCAFVPSPHPTVTHLSLTPPKDAEPDACALYVLSLDDARILWSWGKPAKLIAVGEGAHAWADELTLGYGCDSIALATAESSDVLAVAAVAQEVIAWYQRWDERLVETIVSRADTQALMDVAAEAFNNPLALSDSSLTLIAASGELPQETTGTIWDRASDQDFSPYDYYNYDEQRQLSALGRGSAALRIRPRKNPDHEVILAVAYVGTHMYGSLASVDILAPFPPGADLLLAHVRDRIQQHVLLSDGYRHGGEELTYLLRRAIRGHRVDSGVLSFHLRKLGWDSGEQLRIACFKPAEAVADEGENDRHLSRIKRVLPKSVCLLNGDNVIALVRDSFDELEAGSVGRRSLEKTARDFGMHAGISLAFTGLDHLDSHHLQALEAARIAESTAEAELLTYYEAFDDVLADALLREASIDTVCHPTILRLVREGYKGSVEQGVELVRNLEAYLAYGRNGRMAAERLFVHRNTLVHRVKVLEGLLCLSLDDLDARQMRFLELSCMLALREG